MRLKVQKVTTSFGLPQRDLHSYREAFDEAEPDGNSPPHTSRSPEGTFHMSMEATTLVLSAHVFEHYSWCLLMVEFNSILVE